MDCNITELVTKLTTKWRLRHQHTIIISQIMDDIKHKDQTTEATLLQQNTSRKYPKLIKRIIAEMTVFYMV